MIGWKSTDKSLSASSRTMISHLDKFAIFLEAKSKILPGVPKKIKFFKK